MIKSITFVDKLKQISGPKEGRSVLKEGDDPTLPSTAPSLTWSKAVKVNILLGVIDFIFKILCIYF